MISGRALQSLRLPSEFLINAFPRLAFSSGICVGSGNERSVLQGGTENFLPGLRRRGQPTGARKEVRGRSACLDESRMGCLDGQVTLARRCTELGIDVMEPGNDQKPKDSPLRSNIQFVPFQSSQPSFPVSTKNVIDKGSHVTTVLLLETKRDSDGYMIW
ncbi:hypothetical protein EDB85DRAFT_1529367 [Lactarius pseudohatsudake]|nr:hypothetical protein EDB85DRAFT_1529367 [Lactarius pseudohatsudake]